MLKKVLTIVAAFAFGFAAQAQITDFPYTQGFENGLDGWTVVDSDNDGFTWTIVTNNNESGNYSTHTGVAAISSASWDSEAGALTPDNWLISPAFTLGEGLSLVWFDAAQDGDYPEDHYTVLISRTDATLTSFDTTVADITITTSEFTRHSVDLSALEGQTIRVAFRHHACTDMFVMLIDDIAIMDDRAPVAAIEGPLYAFVGEPTAYTGSMIAGLADGVSYNWSCTGATFDRTDSIAANATFTAAGTYTINFAIHNNYGDDSVSLDVEVLDCTAPNTLPYSYQFEEEVSCWHGENWMLGTDNFGLWGTDTAWLAVSWSIDDEYNPLDNVDNSLVSPLFSIPAEGQFELKYLVYPVSNADHYSVVIRSEGVDDYTLFSENTVEGNGMYMRKLLIPASYAGSDIQVIFRHAGNEPDAYALAIAWPELRPVTAPEVSIVAPRNATNVEDVTLYSIVASAIDVTYAWTINGATTNSATTATVNTNWNGAAEGTYAISLTATNAVGSSNATASIYIFDCSRTFEAPASFDFDNGIGCWTNLDLDGDGLAWSDIDEEFHAMGYGYGEAGPSFAHNSSASAMISWGLYPSYGWIYYAYFGLGTEVSADDLVYSPAVTVPQGQWHLTYYASSPLGDAPSYSVLVSTEANPTSVSDFTVLRQLSPLSLDRMGEDYYTEGSIDLSAYAGQTVRIAFRHQNASGASGLIIDDVTFEQGPASTGINGAADAAISVYPNPAIDQITVDAQGVSRVQVMDAAGRIVLEGTEAGRYDISHLAAGSYLVRVVSAEGVAARRIVKM